MVQFQTTWSEASEALRHYILAPRLLQCCSSRQNQVDTGPNVEPLTDFKGLQEVADDATAPSKVKYHEMLSPSSVILINN